MPIGENELLLLECARSAGEVTVCTYDWTAAGYSRPVSAWNFILHRATELTINVIPDTCPPVPQSETV